MCGIFGYSGDQSAATIVHEGLKRLEYRGYDSWGIVVGQNKELIRNRSVGKLPSLDDVIDLPQSHTGIGHTRWATHGGVTENNAHPHLSSDGRFALAHNGIVENYLELKQHLTNKGTSFKTETDTEVILHLFENNLIKNKSILAALEQTVNELEGRNTCIILDVQTDDIYAFKNGSPLLLGKDETGNAYFSSDSYSLARWANTHYVVDNQQLIHFDQKKRQFIVKDKLTNESTTPDFSPLMVENTTADKEGFDHYMLKEIHDTPYALVQLKAQDKQKLTELAEKIKQARHVYTIASGTAGLSAAQIAYYLRSIAGVNAISLIGAESSDYIPLITKDDLLIAPSQSGETADVLEILEIAKDKGASIATYVNMHGSSMERLADITIHANCGPEICVMSTKMFTSQITWGYLLAMTVVDKYTEAIRDIDDLTTSIESYLQDDRSIGKVKKTAAYLAKKKHIFLLGKGQNQVIVKEGMVKIIEGAYIHAHGMPAGDLKHYAITLIEDDVPVIVVISNDQTKKDTLNAANEVKARGAHVIGTSPHENDTFDETIPTIDTGETCAIFNIIPLQLLAYYIAKEKGNPIDKPRNIAKSVTVK